MVRYLLARLVLTVALLLGLTLVVYLIGAVTPGDPVEILLGEGAPPGEVEQLRSRLGLNLPWYLQYPHYVGQLIRGDLGVSYRSRLSVAEELLRRHARRRLPELVLDTAMQSGGGLLAQGDPRRIELAVTALSGAIVNLFLEWSGGALKVTDEELVDTIVELAAASLGALLR